jgi:hypothetical protein
MRSVSDVFVSYSHVDRPFVRRLHDALSSQGKEVWVDDHGIPPASRWADYLKEAVETADSFLFVISPDSATSVECRKELDHAASLVSTTESGGAIIWSTELAGPLGTLERVAHTLADHQLTAAERKAYL